MARTSIPAQLMRMLGSLRLTVWLLAFAILLVFFGTLDQVRVGIREAQRLYFESLLAVWHYPEYWPGGSVLSKIPVPVPGGYLIGPLLALNLVFSHLRHFRFRWKILGISVIHIGVLMLLIGQLVTNLFQREDYMWLDEGESAHFIRSFHRDELYLAHYRADGTMGVFSYPFERLEAGRVIEAEGFPFEVRVKEVFANAEIQSASAPGQAIASRGIGAQFNLVARRIPSFRSDNQRDVRSAVVEVVRDGRSEGTWLLSNVFEERFAEQEMRLGDGRYAIGLRFKKTYLPFTLELLEFTHERYPGTNIPSNFASRVRLTHPEKGEDREVRIFMNHPLRYEGLTFYQASFAKQDTASMFQVVRNPGRLLPYIACTLVSIGMLYQFGWVLARSMRRTRK
jgi:hypothetical protein